MSLSDVKESMKKKKQPDDNTCFHSVKPKGGGAMKRCEYPRMPGLLTCKMHTKSRLARKTPEDDLQYQQGREFKLGEWCLAAISSHLDVAAATAVATAVHATVDAVSVPVKSAADLVAEARMRGYEGSACDECANFTMVRNGTCLKCDTCGATSGCS